MKICIIGGKGRMGKLFENILINNGHTVYAIGRNDWEIGKKKITESDIIILSVPLSSSDAIINEVSKIVSKDQLVINFASVMFDDVLLMQKISCGSAFIHPLFGPDAKNIKNMNFIIVPVNVKSKKASKSMEDFLEFLKGEGAKLTYSNAKEHDKVMSVIQCLTHFNNMLFAKTMSETIDISKAEEFSTTLFNANKNILQKIFSQSPDMVSNIQFKNEEFLKVLELHKKNLEQLLNIVKNKNSKEFEKIFYDIIKGLEKLNKKENIALTKMEQKWDKSGIAVLGPRGSFTDEACETYFKAKKITKNKIFIDSIKDIILAIKNDKLNTAIIPIENSIHGTVVETLDGINYSGLKINDSVVIPIHMCAAALIWHTKIDTIVSYTPAISQCEKFIEKNYPKAKIIHTHSTSQAFQMIKEKNLENAIAIGPAMAAKIYELEIVHDNIEDEKNNKTKFVIISKKQIFSKNAKTVSIVILPHHEKQGILFNLLRFFNEEKINLTKIESRPLKDKLGKYLFYIDFDGDINDSKSQKAIKNINENVGKVKVLGSYNTIEK